MRETNTGGDIEELDFPTPDVACEGCDRPATVRVIHHDCSVELSCETCHRIYRSLIKKKIAEVGFLICTKCKRHFPDIHTWVQVKPL